MQALCPLLLHASAVCSSSMHSASTLVLCSEVSPCAVNSMLSCSAHFLPTDELERGERSTLSLESMASSHTGRSPSMPRLLDMQEWGYKALAQGIWPAALVLFLSVSTSILVFPFFPYVPSSGSFGDALPQVMKLNHNHSCALRLLLFTVLHCCILGKPLLSNGGGGAKGPCHQRRVSRQQNAWSADLPLAPPWQESCISILQG